MGILIILRHALQPVGGCCLVINSINYKKPELLTQSRVGYHCITMTLGSREPEAKTLLAIAALRMERPDIAWMRGMPEMGELSDGTAQSTVSW